MSKSKNTHLCHNLYQTAAQLHQEDTQHSDAWRVTSTFLSNGKYTRLMVLECEHSSDDKIFAVYNAIEDNTHSYHRTRYEAEAERASVIRKYKQLEASGWPVSSFKAIW